MHRQAPSGLSDDAGILHPGRDVRSTPAESGRPWVGQRRKQAPGPMLIPNLSTPRFSAGNLRSSREGARLEAAVS